MCADAKIQNILPSCADIQAKMIKADKFVSKQGASRRATRDKRSVTRQIGLFARNCELVN